MIFFFIYFISNTLLYLHPNFCLVSHSFCLNSIPQDLLQHRYSGNKFSYFFVFWKSHYFSLLKIFLCGQNSDRLFFSFSISKMCLSFSSSLYCVWLETCCYSQICSSVGDLFFVSVAAHKIFSSSLVSNSLNIISLYLDILCVCFYHASNSLSFLDLSIGIFD